MRIEAAVYQHIENREIEAVVDRKSLVLVGNQSQEFTDFNLDGKSMAELIDLEIFSKVKDTSITLKKDIRIEAEKKMEKVPLKEIRMYLHKDSGVKLWVLLRSKVTLR